MAHPDPQSAPRILIVEDDALIAQDLAESLAELGFEIGLVAYRAETARLALARERFDIAILDINLGGGESGLELARDLGRQHPMPFIFLTALADRNTLDAAKATGPAAYLVKPFKVVDLHTSLEVARYNFQRQHPQSLSLDRLNQLAPTPLTERERDMLQLLLDGHANQEIADRLSISIPTVKTHLSNLYTKLGVRNRVAALAWVRRNLR